MTAPNGLDVATVGGRPRGGPMSLQKDMESKVARTWARRTWQRWWRAALSVAAVGIAVATVSSMASHLQLRQSVALLRSTDLRRLAAIAPMLLTANLCLKAARFRSLLRTAAGHAVPFRQVLASVVLSAGANNLLPLR